MYVCLILLGMPRHASLVELSSAILSLTHILIPLENMNENISDSEPNTLADQPLQRRISNHVSRVPSLLPRMD